MLYDFDQCLNFSKTAQAESSDILTIKSMLTKCSEVLPANIEMDKSGVDYIAKTESGREIYIDIKTRNLTGNIAKLEKRADSLRQLFGSKSRQSYSQQILDANEAFKMNLANTEISQRDKSVIFEIYAEVMKNLEVSRMLLINQMPVIQVLDRPKDPLVDVRMPLVKLLAIAFLLSTVFGILLATLSFRMPQGNGA